MYGILFFARNCPNYLCVHDFQVFTNIAPPKMVSPTVQPNIFRQSDVSPLSMGNEGGGVQQAQPKRPRGPDHRGGGGLRSSARRVPGSGVGWLLAATTSGSACPAAGRCAPFYAHFALTLALMGSAPLPPLVVSYPSKGYLRGGRISL